ncbi:ATP/GTP-binding protein [Microtetraspora malaysiensis]|uniref:ATP/GTP-binding protein n=1 Tax=Microtetraspora malaysiensis TaxID=161358 RepID=UPI003D945269
MSPRRARRSDGSSRRSRRPGYGGRGGDGADDEGLGFAGRFGIGQVEEWPDGEWQVRRIVGGAADKVYRCPGCDQEIRTGLAHLVSWPNWTGGENERRHWHTACWRNRVKRGPGRTRY